MGLTADMIDLFALTILLVGMCGVFGMGLLLYVAVVE